MELLERKVEHVAPIDKDFAFGCVEETIDELDKRRLARTRGAHNGNCLARLRHKTHVGEARRAVVGIGEGDIAKLNAAVLVGGDF